MASTLDLLKRLTDRNVEFVVVGGIAAMLHGGSMVTQDLDVCAPLDEQNMSRILDALRDTNPRSRMHPDRPRLADNVQAFAGYKNLYLATDLGQIDIHSEVSGVGGYANVTSNTMDADFDGICVRVLNIETLILSKRSLGRPRDIQAAIELEWIRDPIQAHE